MQSVTGGQWCIEHVLSEDTFASGPAGMAAGEPGQRGDGQGAGGAGSGTFLPMLAWRRVQSWQLVLIRCIDK